MDTWNSLGQNTGMGSLSLLQGIFPTQGSNPGLPHCRQILYQLSHKRTPKSERENSSVMSLSYSPWKSPGQNTGVGSHIPSPEGLPNPGMEPSSPALQEDSLPAEPQGKSRNTGVGSLSLLQGLFPTQGWNPALLHCRQSLYQLSYQGLIMSYQICLPRPHSNSL